MNDTATKRPRTPPPLEFDEAPELTGDMLARARPASEVHGPERAETMLRKRGRPAKAEGERKQQVTLRLSAPLLAAMRASGDGWQTRLDELVAAALDFGAFRATRRPQREERLLEAAIALATGAAFEIEVSNDDTAMRAAGEKAEQAAADGRSLFERMANLSRDAATGALEAKDPKGARARAPKKRA